jgi:hypothetical protein
MANVLTTGVWLFAPSKNHSFFARLLRGLIASREQRAEREVAHYIATHGLQRLSDGAERNINSLYSRGAR